MAINPDDINTLRVGQLPPNPFGLTDKIPHEIGTDLNQGTVQQLADTIGTYLGTADSIAFNPTTVLDGQTLPATDSAEWLLVGKGTFVNIGGGADITTTEELNAIVSNGTNWSLGVAIPIVVDPPDAMISQTVNAGVTNFSPSEDAVRTAIDEKVFLNAVGSFHYADLTTQTTPLAIVSTVPLKLTNDALGLYTIVSNAPYGVSSVWNTVTNQLDFNELTVGDILTLRVDANVTTGSANQTLKCYAKLGIGSASEFDLILAQSNIKTAGTYPFVAEVSLDLAYQDIVDNPAEFYIVSDGGGTITINGWYVEILRKNINIVDIVTDLGYIPEDIANKQNSLAFDGTGIKYPTVDAVNTGLATKQNALTNPITGTGTTNKIAKFTASGVIGDSAITDSGVIITTSLPVLSNPALSAVINNEILVGLDLFPTFSTGAFTGVKKYTARVKDNFIINSTNYNSEFIINSPNNTPILSFLGNASSRPIFGYKGLAFRIGSITGEQALGLSEQFSVFSASGNVVIKNGGTHVDNGVDKLQVNGTISATAATTASQVVVKSQLDGKVSLTGNETIAGVKTFSSNILSNSLVAVSSDQLTLTSGSTSLTIDDTDSTTKASGDIQATNFIRTTSLPGQLLKADGNVTVGYKVYTALVSQSGTSAPTAIVLENTLGGTVVWTRSAQGSYVATLSSAFVLNKTAFISTSSNSSTILAGGYATTSTVAISTSDGGVSFDGLMSNSFIEIRVYN